MPNSKETLGQYVARVVKERGLKHHEVRQMSGGKITDGYVRGIMTGKAKNPSVDKLKALARGLGVSEDEIFRVARGVTTEGEAKTRDGQLNYQLIVNLMSNSLKNRTLAELLSEVARLSFDSQEEALKVLSYLNARKQRSSRSKKGVGR
jgi:transcriptional regulator with XRE-family HTH domain